uniref:Tuberin n=1 Tax=Aceria tosichella TaxID=561515 RepID=A0A6G1SBK3_9ACAR
MNEGDSQMVELLAHHTESINVLNDRWITDWAALAEKHYKLEEREFVRTKVVDATRQIFNKYHVIYGDELMSKVIIPNFNDVDQETSPQLRKSLIHLLNDVASNCISYKHCNTVLAILRRMLTRPFRQRNEELNNGIVYIFSNRELIDSRAIVSNLNKLFVTKLHRLPIDPAVNILDILVSYLNLTFKHPLQGPAPAELPLIRKEILLLLLSLRCDMHGHLGVGITGKSDDNITFSPFILCVKKPRTTDGYNQHNQHQVPLSPGAESQTQFQLPNTNIHPSPLNQIIQDQQHNTISQQQQQHHSQNIFVPNSLHPNCPIESRCINLDAMFAGIIECINIETDAELLETVLKGLPHLLANKPLVLTAGDERINQLCLALSNLITMNRANNRQTIKTDHHKHCLRCLTSLLIYRKLLDHKSIKMILSIFEDSIRSVSRYPIVPLFTTCLIELHDSSEMAKFVPIVLDHLRRFSPTVSLGPSVLEFLTYLIIFPKLYENFSQDEYKFIFSIALPYTNPFRFSDYITCLAFRVIAMWYLNCRPSLRCAFVEQVKKSLRSNVIQPFKENTVPSQPVLHSQTSSPVIAQTPPITYSCPPSMSPVDHRRRSSSLNAETYLRNQQGILNSHNHQSSLQLNEELMETFADLLTRYTHGQYLAIAPKNRCTEMLIDRSTSQTWLNGNSLITITAGKSNNGWAEIMVRRPTGNTSWIGRLQNTVGALPMFNQQVYTDSLNFGNDIISLFSSLSLTSEDGSGTGDAELSDSLTALSSNAANLSSSLSSSTNAASTGQMDFGATSNSCKLQDPIPLPKDKKFDIALSNFDLITPYETHKVGLVYVGKNQAENRAAILSNKFGSPRYYEFLSQIGTCIILNDIDPEIYFVGGLDVKGEDGKYAYFWKDNVTQVIFHVATFMLARDNDPQCNNKNRHIGNDHVCIVFNDSGAPFKLSTIKGTGQFIKACVVVVPLDDDTNFVDVEVLPELKSIVGDIESRILSNLSAALYARQISIHLNLASKIFERRHCEGFFSKEPYVSNWVERLRCIKRIRQRIDESRRANANGSGGSLSAKGSNTLR